MSRERPQPRLATSVAASGHDGAPPVLSAIELDGERLANAPISTVMPDGSYQLLLEELPNAPREELTSALGWRIRDRIDMPLDEAVIEILDMPPQARASGSKSAYAVVSSREAVVEQVARIRTAGLKLDTIDLPELCMRNIAVRLPQDADGVAFLHFTDEHGLLTITRQGVLYLIRRIDVGRLQLGMNPATPPDSDLVSSICLELQRSLDYYETHFDLPSVSSLVLGPGAGTAGLVDAIGMQLAVSVDRLDFSSLFEMSTELDDDTQANGLFAVGATLRPDAAGGRGA